MTDRWRCLVPEDSLLKMLWAEGYLAEEYIGGVASIERVESKVPITVTDGTEFVGPPMFVITVDKK